MFFEFIKNHFELIISVVLLVGSIVIASIRKKPIGSIAESIFNASIKAVKMVELDSKNYNKLDSKTKLEMAINYVYEILKVSYPDVDLSCYRNFIINSIEEILSTPQKK